MIRPGQRLDKKAPSMQPAGTPHLSVVMMAYGDLRFLDEAVDSILRQDYRDFEFILVDDAAEQPDVFERLALRDPRIQVISYDQNLGPAAAANRGIAVARGDIIARLDADDVAEPSRLGRLLAAFAVDPQIGMIGSWFTRIDEHNYELEVVRTPTSDLELRWLFLFHNPFCHSSIAFRKAVFDAAGCYNENANVRASEDADLWYRMITLCRVGCLPCVLVRYRVNPRGLSAANPPNWRLRTEASRRLLWRSLGVSYTPEIIADLVQFVSGWDVGGIDRRRQVYARILELLRKFAQAKAPFGRAGDRSDMQRMKNTLIGRVLSDSTIGPVAWTECCWLAWRIDRIAALKGMGRRVFNSWNVATKMLWSIVCGAVRRFWRSRV